MRKVIMIDERGFFVEDVILEDNEFTPEGCIDFEVPQGFYRPKWNGFAWEEGLTQEELQLVNKPQIKEPSMEDYILDMDFRLTKMELGL